VIDELVTGVVDDEDGDEDVDGEPVLVEADMVVELEKEVV
jgi:hypothetical protein